MNKVLYSSCVVSAALLANSYSTSIAYDRPVHAVIAIFAVVGCLLVGLDKSFPSLFKQPRQNQGYSAVPLADRYTPQSSHDTFEQEEGICRGDVDQQASTLLSLGAGCALVARVELMRHISAAPECTISSVGVIIPLILSIYDYIRFQKPGTITHYDPPDATVYDAAYTNLRQFYSNARWKYVPPALILTLSCHKASALWSSTNSTYICPLVGGETRTIPFFQWLATFLDCFLAIVASELFPHGWHATGNTRARGPLTWGILLMGAAVSWTLIGLIVFAMKPDYRGWLMLLEYPLTTRFFSALLWQITLFSILCIGAAHCILYIDILGLSMTLTAIFVMIPCLKFVWSARRPFPPLSSKTTILSLLLIYGSRWLWARLRPPMASERPTSISRQTVAFLAFLMVFYPLFRRTNQVNFHPIDLLIYQGRLQHQNYVASVTLSKSLLSAVTRYQQLYTTTPPPGFDIWYEYARNRSSIIMDKYDQIYNDLLPFRAISPADLRRLTWEMVSNPWNDISGITIRNGVAAVQGNVLPTHRWMLEGVAIFINKFAQFLPDMDLAFNLSDESRVAVPYDSITTLRAKGVSMLQPQLESQAWSTNRSDGWLPIPDEEYTETVFQQHSFRNTFYSFGSIGCEPSSAARRLPHTSSNSHLCLSCLEPHSLGQFISNWTLATDPCHQPDLAHLHGFYLSPAAFKASYHLMPVFSQSKPHGFNDILYPSAWNYMDKVMYDPTEPSGTPGSEDYNTGNPDPDFGSKQNTLFWRGATSEGVSGGEHTWRGMTRQRLVHMANNFTNSAHDAVTVLLPDQARHSGKLKYQTLPASAVESLGLHTDIAIVDHIARCGGIGLHDCKDQEAEFGLVGPREFQGHWSYRYLFDLDGAGFSGRFLPFLQSKSLPFKTALFREWYDERITAWRHFVPQDVRLHGVWSTLAYFAGVEGKVSGRGVTMGAHIKEGEMIAMDGREWAGQVLRKEDMEIYFFRLLLEWGRLTDDRRDELGFVVD